MLEGLIHAIRAQGKDAGPHEEHGEHHEEDGGVELRAGDALLGLLTVLRLHIDGELRERCHVGEGEDQNRQDEEDAFKHLAPAISTVIEVDKALEVPARNEVDGGHRQRDDERVDQYLGQPDHGLAADGKSTGHDSDADGGKQPAVQRRAAELIDNEAVHRVGDGDAVDQHGGKDRNPIQQGEDDTRALAQVLGNELKDVLAMIFLWGTGHDARVGAV